MGKKGKIIAKEKRLQKKRALKAANKAKYASWKFAGENGKSSRSRKKNKNSKSFKEMHPVFCGNIACNKCFSKTELHIVKKNW